MKFFTKRVLKNFFTLCRYVESLFGDLWLNVNTHGSDYFQKGKGKNKDGVEFTAVSHSAIQKSIRLVKPNINDIVFDLGSGKGRVIFHFARLNVRKVIGVELSDNLCRIARRNIERLRKVNAPINIINDDIINVDLSEGTIFFMFNPFGEKTMREVLSKIELTLKLKNRLIKIIYINPKFAHIFKEYDWLKIKYMYKRITEQQTIIYINR